VEYAEKFVNHEVKIKKAFDYFRSNNFHVCMILAQGCPGQTSDVEEGNWHNVIVDLGANTEARHQSFIPISFTTAIKIQLLKAHPMLNQRCFRGLLNN
jgi:hypothetical protein